MAEKEEISEKETVTEKELTVTVIDLEEITEEEMRIKTGTDPEREIANPIDIARTQTRTETNEEDLTKIQIQIKSQNHKDNFKSNR